MPTSLELQQRILLSSLAPVNELKATRFLADGNVQFAGIFSKACPSSLEEVLLLKPYERRVWTRTGFSVTLSSIILSPEAFLHRQIWWN